MRERLFGKGIHIAESCTHSHERIGKDCRVRASDAPKRVQQDRPMRIKSDPALPVGQLNILHPAHIIACQIIQNSPSALFRRQRHKFTSLFSTHFIVVGQKVGMLFQNIHNAGQGLLAAHTLVPLG